MFKSRPFIVDDSQLLPSYNTTEKLRQTQNILHYQNPLVSIKETKELQQLIAKASVGEYFLIQSGDCTENVYENRKYITNEKLDFIQLLATFLQKKTGRNTIKVDRFAEQYAIPRTKQYEVYEEKRIVGGLTNQFQEKCHAPNHSQMLLTYHCSASIHQEIEQWNQEKESEQKIYTSHESSLIYYAQALTWADKQTGLYYNGSTHFPWLDKHAINSMQHINYMKNIANPIALKIGPDTSINALIEVINELDPTYLPGRITLIPRLGIQHLHSFLPQLIDAVRKTKRNVLWSCDPMQGNTETINAGIKTRKLNNIIEEIRHSFDIHRKMRSQLNAIHLESTYQYVTECMNYESSPDNEISRHKNRMEPRLNFEQTMHVFQFIAKQLVNCL